MNSIIGRQCFRAAQPLKPSTRRYASTSSGSDVSSKLIYLLAGSAIGVGIGLYWKGKREGTTPTDAVKSVTSAVSKAAKPAFTGGDQGFFDLKLDSVEEINHNTKKFRFALPDSDHVSGLQVASALLTKYKGPEMEKPVIRPYTPVSDEGEKGFIDLLVKRYPNGPMSEHMHNMQPGQRLEFKGPIPKYSWTPNKHDHVAMIAGGTGITPMYQVARAIFADPSDKTRVTLIFGNLTENDILLKRELEDLENTYPQRFRAFYLVDKPENPDTWRGGKGHVNTELLKTVLPEPKSTTGGKPKAELTGKEGEGKEDFKVFVCGPPGLYKAVSGTKNSPTDQGELSGILKELGYSREQVFKF